MVFFSPSSFQLLLLSSSFQLPASSVVQVIAQLFTIFSSVPERRLLSGAEVSRRAVYCLLLNVHCQLFTVQNLPLALYFLTFISPGYSWFED